MKQQLRTYLESRRRALTDAEVKESSARLVSRIRMSECYQQADTVLIYYPIRGEISLLDLLSDDKTFLFPVVTSTGMELHPFAGWERMREGAFHIQEPDTPAYTEAVDLLLIPGVAFDEQGGRLGRGGGYYDRFLTQSAGMRVGVCYDWQVVPELELDPWDVRMQTILTDLRTIEW